MSSRKQDAQKLVELAEVASTNADNLQKAATLLGRYNEAINRLEQRLIEVEQATDDIEHRLLSLEGPRVSPPPFDYLPPI